jgi:hypothetical protein
MKKYNSLIYILILFLCQERIFCDQQIDQRLEQVVDQQAQSNADDIDQDDEKLLEEILDVLSSSYKNIVDIAALYFCGLSLDRDKLYEQIFILLSRDMLNVVKIFASYVPAMLKNPKLKTKDKFKKSIYVIASTMIFWYISSELLSKKLNNNSLTVMRTLNLNLHNTDDNNKELLKPRSRLKIDSKS